MADARDLTHFIEPLDDGLARMDLAVDGIRCPACMAKIEAALAQVPNVTLARSVASGRTLRA